MAGCHEELGDDRRELRWVERLGEGGHARHEIADVEARILVSGRRRRGRGRRHTRIEGSRGRHGGQDRSRRICLGWIRCWERRRHDRRLGDGERGDGGDRGGYDGGGGNGGVRWQRRCACLGRRHGRRAKLVEIALAATDQPADQADHRDDDEHGDGNQGLRAAALGCRWQPRAIVPTVSVACFTDGRTRRLVPRWIFRGRPRSDVLHAHLLRSKLAGASNRGPDPRIRPR